MPGPVISAWVCVLFALLAATTEAYNFLDICHCPGEHQLLKDWYSADSGALRDKLLELRRGYTNGWDVYSPPGAVQTMRHMIICRGLHYAQLAGSILTTFSLLPYSEALYKVLQTSCC